MCAFIKIKIKIGKPMYNQRRNENHELKTNINKSSDALLLQ